MRGELIPTWVHATGWIPVAMPDGLRRAEAGCEGTACGHGRWPVVKVGPRPCDGRLKA